MAVFFEGVFGDGDKVLGVAGSGERVDEELRPLRIQPAWSPRFGVCPATPLVRWKGVMKGLRLCDSIESVEELNLDLSALGRKLIGGQAVLQDVPRPSGGVRELALAEPMQETVGLFAGGDALIDNPEFLQVEEHR